MDKYTTMGYYSSYEALGCPEFAKKDSDARVL